MGPGPGQTRPMAIMSVKELGVFCFVFFTSDVNNDFLGQIRKHDIVGNGTCFSMSLMVSSEALSFDFFTLFIALVRTFRKESLALFVFCLASFTSISLCSRVTLIKDTKKSSIKSSHV